MQRKTQPLRVSKRKVLIFAFPELKDTSTKKSQKRANSKIKRKQKEKTKKSKMVYQQFHKRDRSLNTQ